MAEDAVAFRPAEQIVHKAEVVEVYVHHRVAARGGGRSQGLGVALKTQAGGAAGDGGNIRLFPQGPAAALVPAAEQKEGRPQQQGGQQRPRTAGQHHKRRVGGKTHTSSTSFPCAPGRCKNYRAGRPR